MPDSGCVSQILKFCQGRIHLKKYRHRCRGGGTQTCYLMTVISHKAGTPKSPNVSGWFYLCSVMLCAWGCQCCLGSPAAKLCGVPRASLHWPPGQETNLKEVDRVIFSVSVSPTQVPHSPVLLDEGKNSNVGVKPSYLIMLWVSTVTTCW